MFPLLFQPIGLSVLIALSGMGCYIIGRLEANESINGRVHKEKNQKNKLPKQGGLELRIVLWRHCLQASLTRKIIFEKWRADFFREHRFGAFHAHWLHWQFLVAAVFVLFGMRRRRVSHCKGGLQSQKMRYSAKAAQKSGETTMSLIFPYVRPLGVT